MYVYQVRKDFSTDPSFAAGLALLPPLSLSFDLQVYIMRKMDVV
jgi:hypothetical protein